METRREEHRAARGQRQKLFALHPGATLTSRWRALGVATTCALAAAIALTIWWRLPPDPSAELRRRALRFAGVARDSTTAKSAGLELWRIATADGDTFDATWRPAPVGIEEPWTIIMMGGLGTGQRAAALLPAHVPVQLLAVEWPWRGPRRLSSLGAVRRLGAMHEAVLRSPGVFALGVEAAAVQPEVARDRVAVLGASLGAPIAMAALQLTDAPTALVVLDGFADLERVLDQALRREGRSAALATPIAGFAARLLHPVEPRHHTSRAAALPALVLNARDDERIPSAAIERLWAALPHAERRWRDGKHLRAHRDQLIAELCDEVTAWLATLD